MAIELYEHPLLSDANLLGYYRLEGNSNDSKNSNNGTDTSIDYGTNYGKFNQGAHFSAAAANSYYITLPAAVAITGGTVMLWVYLTDGGSPYTLFDRLNGDSRAAPDRRLKFYLYTTQMILQTNNGSSTSDTFSDVTNAWHHLAVTFASSGTAYFYLDGQPVGDDTAHGSIGTNGETVKVGKNNDDTNYPFGGYMDDIAIFNRVLTAAEILSFYNYSKAGFFAIL